MNTKHKIIANKLKFWGIVYLKKIGKGEINVGCANLDKGLDCPFGYVQECWPSTHVRPLAHWRRSVNEKYYDSHVLEIAENFNTLITISTTNMHLKIVSEQIRNDRCSAWDSSRQLRFANQLANVYTWMTAILDGGLGNLWLNGGSVKYACT